MNIYIASDFHLKFVENEEDLARKERVINFLESIKGKSDVLVLNGDIFDLWFTWHKVIIKGYFPFLKKLADLKESGTRIVFIAGNHDFWFRDFLTEYIGAEVYPDNFSEQLDEKKIFITHGDLHTTNDIRYKIFRSVIRNKIVMTIFELLHPDLSLSLGRKMSRSSRNRPMSTELMQLKENGLTNFAKKKLKDYDIVAMGHSHSPKKLEMNGGVYLNSGDWIKNNSYILIEDGKAKLCNFKG